METHLVAPVAIGPAYQPHKSATFNTFGIWYSHLRTATKLILVADFSRKGPFYEMAETPVAMLVGAGMIVLGTLVAVWIVISIVRQNRRDRSFPE
jgi:hypothetical protein